VLADQKISECLVAGWSGGGPHALACAARLRGVQAALIIAARVPHDAPGLDFNAGMSPDNVREFAMAAQRPTKLRDLLESRRHDLAVVTPQELASSPMLTPRDIAAYAGNVGEDMAAHVRAAVETGIDGFFDDDLALIRPWGFAFDDITIPVTVWHGDADRVIPIQHFRWNVAHLKTAIGHERAEGHLSIVVNDVNAMLGELISLAG